MLFLDSDILLTDQTYSWDSLASDMAGMDWMTLLSKQRLMLRLDTILGLMNIATGA